MKTAVDPAVNVVDQALWVASRATGLVALLLLSATILLGVATNRRYATSGWARFSVLALHRNLSLLGLVFVAVHAATAVIDPYAGIRWTDAVLPFIAVYQPVWLGLGTVALDLMAAVVVSSLLRSRIPLPVWRGVHWASYALFPVALVHALGIAGADGRLGWVLGWLGCCALAVIAAGWWRARGRVHADTHARRVDQQGGWL